MTPMAPTRPNRPTRPASPPLPVSQHQCRIPLMADLAAAAGARSVVEDCIRSWRVPVDADVAILLTSELVTNAVTHGRANRRNVRASHDRLRRGLAAGGCP